MSSIDDDLRKRRTFVLGAGFSAAAGVPLTNALLPEALHLFRANAPGLLARIENQAKICFENQQPIHNQKLDAAGFAKLCSYLHYIELGEHGGGERWCDAGSRELVALRYYIARYLASVTPSESKIPKLYLRFAEQLTKYDCVLTFNWDTLLENAISAVGKRCVYSLDGIDLNDPSSDDIVLLVKLHGSINWCLDTTSFKKQPGWRRLSNPSMPNVDVIYANNSLTTAEGWEKISNSFLDVQPFLVLPGHGKSHDVRRLSEIWYKPGGYFYVSRDVYVIGLSLSDDDYFVRFFMLDSLPLGPWKSMDRRLVVINPSDRDMNVGYGFLHESECRKLRKRFDHDDIAMMIARSEEPSS